MTATSPRKTQRIIPYLAYADAPAAIGFLCRAFGFEERERYVMDDGKIGHAELSYQDNVLMLASVFESFGLVSPKNLEAVHGQVFCYVEDVDAHFATAKAAGATIASEPADQAHGTRMYRAVDPEGHHWIFAEATDGLT